MGLRLRSEACGERVALHAACALLQANGRAIRMLQMLRQLGLLQRQLGLSRPCAGRGLGCRYICCGAQLPAGALRTPRRPARLCLTEGNGGLPGFVWVPRAPSGENTDRRAGRTGQPSMRWSRRLARARLSGVRARCVSACLVWSGEKRIFVKNDYMRDRKV